MMATQAVKIFYCYARKDKVLRDGLESHLVGLKRSKQVQIITWYDREILPGDEWKREIDRHLDTSDIILLLISPDFIESEYCYGVEMQRALERHEAGVTHVLPIILRPCGWKKLPVSILQALPEDGKPITTWDDCDEAFQNVVVGVSKVVRRCMTQKAERESNVVHQTTDQSQRERKSNAQANTSHSFQAEEKKISEEANQVILNALTNAPHPHPSRIEFAQALEKTLPTPEPLRGQKSDVPPVPTSVQLKRYHTLTAVGLILLTLTLLMVTVYGSTTGKWPWNAFHGSGTLTSNDLATATAQAGQKQSTVTAQAEVNTAWIPQKSGTPQNLNDVAWSGSQFVVVGKGGTILTSYDGHAWIPQKSGTSQNLNGVVWSGSQFVIVGDYGAILTSLNGYAWTPPKYYHTSLHAVTWSGSQFVAVGEDGMILTSPDGQAWTPQDAGLSPDLNPNYALNGVVWSGSQFVAVAGGTTIYARFLTSPDGHTWTHQNSDHIMEFHGIAWSGSQLVAVAGGLFTSVCIFTSPDGQAWTPQDSEWSFLHDVTWTGSQFVAVGDVILTSPDGRTWTPPQYYVQHTDSSQAHWLNGVAGSGSHLVVVGDYGMILTRT